MDIISKRAGQIIATLNKSGFKAFIVGGSVRDFLLGRKASDYDILTDASIDQINTIFKSEKVKIVGQSFKTCLVNKIEICPARSKSRTGNFPENDLEMRDFTMNSMAYNLETKTIFDLFCGKKDLKKKSEGLKKILNKRLKEIL
ncbi:MAG: hypothetical protein K8R67_07165 [Desulfobacteraceae bacterium]|nr:hypothetical protein [Desulfobacteraceae bacterium]